MASRAPAKRDTGWRIMLKRSMMRAGQLLGAALLGLSVLFLLLALLSYHGSDPSMNTVAGTQPRNIMGLPGSYAADFLLWLLGLGTVLLLPLIAILARRMWIEDDMAGWSGQLGRCLSGIVLTGLGLSLLAPGAPVALPAGRGGIVGQLVAVPVLALTGMAGGWSRWIEWALILLCVAAGATIAYRSWRLERPLFRLGRFSLPRFSLRRPVVADAADPGPTPGNLPPLP